jgi:hypothetical protein
MYGSIHPFIHSPLCLHGVVLNYSFIRVLQGNLGHVLRLFKLHRKRSAFAAKHGSRYLHLVISYFPGINEISTSDHEI